MRISYNWLKELFPAAPAPEETAAILTQSGLEVEGIEPYESITGGLSGLVVGHVVDVWKHPDADRLRLTRVDVGNGATLQIVCGAPNVATGQKVVVATEGATLHPLEGEPFTIRKGKIRGEVSEGMLCAEDEIGLGKGHAGIMVLDPDAVPGAAVRDLLGVTSDSAIEIGLTPNRTDAMSHYGVARDLRAAMQHFGVGTASTLPGVNQPKLAKFDELAASIHPSKKIDIEIANPEACHRYAGVVLTGATVQASPAWLQNRLKAIGLTPINNLVDVTNYVMHELGHPLHAFDADQIGGDKVVVRCAHTNEAFTTLDDQQRALQSDDLVICDATKPMCIAGVFGGKTSGISESTTSVFIESAVFDPVFVRRTARRHQLNTDASYRFERGVDADMTLVALKRAALLMIELSGARLASGITDLYPTVHIRAAIKLNLDRMNKLIGKVLPVERVEKILIDLDFEIVSKTDAGFDLLAPLYRRDVTREADVVEEVLRIYGYDNVEIPSRVHASVSGRPQPDTESLHRRTADVLVARGFNEIMNNSLTRLAYSDRYDLAELSAPSAVKLLNPLSSDLGQLRQSLLFQGLETVSRNINFKNADQRLFEFGYTYHRTENGTVERPVVALWVTGRQLPENWNNSSARSGFAELRAGIRAVLEALGANKNLVQEALSHAFFTDAIVYRKGQKEIVRAGLLSQRVLDDADIRQSVCYAEIDWSALVKLAAKNSVVYEPLPKFPAVRRDLSLLVDRSVTFAQLEASARNAERKLLREVGLFDVYEGKNLPENRKSYALSFILRDDQATLTDTKIDGAMERILNAIVTDHRAELRS